MENEQAYRGIGMDRETLVQFLEGMHAMSGFGVMDAESFRAIAEEIADEVAQDVYDTADIEAWSNDDFRLAVGRVLRRRLGIAS